MPELIVHHLHYSQSERIPWLLHELKQQGVSIPYKLAFHHRAPLMSPPELVALHPMHAAPVLQDGNVTLAESGAIIEYIIDVYGSGKLKLRPSDAEYVDFLYWWHWSNSNLQPVLMRGVTVSHLQLPADHPIMKNVNERMAVALGHLNERVKANEWIAGKTFTAADIMVVFSLTTMRRFFSYSLEGYDGILSYLGRVAGREGYKASMAEADPDMDYLEATKGPAPRKFLQVRPEIPKAKV
jgi:glutathione S-transferase